MATKNRRERRFLMNLRNLFDLNLNVRIVKKVYSLTGARIAILSMLVIAFSASAMAQCSASLNTMAAAAASVRSESQTSRSLAPSSAPGGNGVSPSIVGLWHIRFLVGDSQIQEAFQIWNTGGTEVHNPNVDPRTGSICLGAWEEVAARTFKLTHRVWMYDTIGNCQGLGVLTETLTLGDRGSTHSGSFTLAFYDPAGNFLFEVPGTVIGERITVN
jgi:hypothetical protein